MSIRERLKIAYENVAYSADKTWRTEYFNLQKSHMDLFLRESQLQLPTKLELRPRTVRDCIPKSKLASYSNYEYNYSRELSYNMDNVSKPPKPSLTFDRDLETEPWMFEEVDQLFKWYSNEESDVKQKGILLSCKPYESPFLKTSSLSECFLKLQITDSQVRKIWDVRNRDSECMLLRSAKEDPYLLYKSPTRQIFLSEYDRHKDELKNEVHEWHRSEQARMDNLSLVNKKFDDEKIKIQGETNTIQHRRLYSAVLQGFSTSKIPSSSVENKMTILKRNLTKNGMEKLGSISEVNRTKTEEIVSIRSAKADYLPRSTSNNFNNKNYPNSSKTIMSNVYNPLYAVNHIQSQLDGLSHQNSLFPNSFLPTATNLVSTTPVAPRFRQAYPPNNCQYPSFYMLIQNSIQQQNFLQPPLYNPVVLHRNAAPINLERSIPQRPMQLPVNNQPVTPQLGSIPHNHYKKNKFQKKDPPVFKHKTRIKLENLQEKRAFKSSGLISLVNIRKISDISSCSSGNNTSKQDATNEDSNIDFERLVLKTVDVVLNDSKSDTIVPVTESSSERLERQALEQYQNSYDNVFLELERQAAEEYEDCPENCKDPPNLKFFFRGAFIQCHYFRFSMDKYFKYLVSSDAF